ncbi:MAG: helix-turn-helix domain-containing protein [Acidimicrobiales bacterium]
MGIVRTLLHRKYMANVPAADIRHLAWAAEQLGIGVSTAYRLAATGATPRAFKVGGQWRVSVPRFLAEVHGSSNDDAAAV